jgi:hypothetical protein
MLFRPGAVREFWAMTFVVATPRNANSCSSREGERR